MPKAKPRKSVWVEKHTTHAAERAAASIGSTQGQNRVLRETVRQLQICVLNQIVSTVSRALLMFRENKVKGQDKGGENQ